MTWFFHVDSYQPPDWWAQVHWYYPGDDYVDWLGISDYGDYYWGRGAVGPTLPQSLINSWWYIKGTDALQTFP